MTEKIMRKKLLLRAAWWPVGVLAYLLYQLAFRHPEKIEQIYSRGIYPFFTKIFAHFTAYFAVSLSELLIYALVIGVAVFVVFFIRCFFRRNKLYHALRMVISLISAVSVGYAAFVFGWGLNYARMPLASSMGLSTVESTPEELTTLCRTLIARTNALREQVREDENGVFVLSDEKEYYLTHVQELYDDHALPIMNQGGKSRVKLVFTKNALSVTRTMGIFSAFTYECHMNGEMPDLYVPSTAAHEYAHFKGFAREDEANFIAWYVSYNSDNIDYAYSGAALALLYAMNSLYATDKETHAELYYSLHEGIIRDWVDDNAYWEPFRTEFSDKTNKAYDNYLKSNKVSDGAKSYGRMLDLLLAMQREGLL